MSGTKNARQRMRKSRVQETEREVIKGQMIPQNQIDNGRKNIIFVPDTNVFMSDPEVLFRLGEHDILLSWNVSDEIDKNKVLQKGDDEDQVANARKTNQMLNYFAHSVPVDQLHRGVRLVKPGEKKKRGKVGRLYFNKPPSKDFVCGYNLDMEKADFRILLECLEFMDRESKRTGIKRKLILLSKDKNMRTAARTLGIEAEDYRNNAPTEESLRSTGMHYFPLTMLKAKGLKEGVIPRPLQEQDGKAEYLLIHKVYEKILPYEFVIFGSKEEPKTQRQYVVIEKKDPSTMLVRELRDYQYTNKVFYEHARNVGQNCLVNSIVHLKSELIIGEGAAGTGKTHIALACAFQQIKDGTRRRVLITRDAVESGQKIGFLPGKLEAKIKNFLIGFEGNRDKLIALLDKDIAEKRRLTKLAVVHENVDLETPRKRKRKTKVQRREEKRRSNNNTPSASNKLASDSPEVQDLLKLRARLVGDADAVVIVSLGHLRGANHEADEVIIVDEHQHTTEEIGEMLGTRGLDGGQLLFIGNTRQDDIGIPLRKSGIAKLIDATKGTDLMSLITLEGSRGRLSARITEYYRK